MPGSFPVEVKEKYDQSLSTSMIIELTRMTEARAVIILPQAESLHLDAPTNIKLNTDATTDPMMINSCMKVFIDIIRLFTG